MLSSDEIGIPILGIVGFASLILGFTDTNALRAFFGSGGIATLSNKLPEFVSAVHAYEVSEALTYVKDGKVLPHYQT